MPSLFSPAHPDRRRDERAQPLELELLRDIAAGTARATTLWRPIVRHDPTERRPVRLLATDQYEVWVIGWTTGQSAPLHDHGDAAGAILVVEGTLTELTVTASGVATDRLPAGTVKDLGVGLVHEIVNEHERSATSIHVYSPPLQTMTRYDHTSLEATVIELVAADEPAIGGSAESVLAHPSARG